MSLVNDKLFERFCASTKGKVTPKIRAIRVRHKWSMGIDKNLIVHEGDIWKVPSSQIGQMHIVKLNNVDCRCRIMCYGCKACIHKYRCTCRDASIKTNMCKHIHSVCQAVAGQTKPTEKPANSVNERQLTLSQRNENGTAKQIIQLSDWKKRTAVEFNDLLNTITTSSSRRVVDKYMASLKATLLSVKNKKQDLVMARRKENRRKISPQRKFFSTKKRKVTKRVTLAVPTNQEAEQITETLLDNLKYIDNGNLKKDLHTISACNSAPTYCDHSLHTILQPSHINGSASVASATLSGESVGPSLYQCQHIEGSPSTVVTVHYDKPMEEESHLSVPNWQIMTCGSPNASFSQTNESVVPDTFKGKHTISNGSNSVGLKSVAKPVVTTAQPVFLKWQCKTSDGSPSTVVAKAFAAPIEERSRPLLLKLPHVTSNDSSSDSIKSVAKSSVERAQPSFLKGAHRTSVGSPPTGSTNAFVTHIGEKAKISMLNRHHGSFGSSISAGESTETSVRETQDDSADEFPAFAAVSMLRSNTMGPSLP